MYLLVYSCILTTVAQRWIIKKFGCLVITEKRDKFEVQEVWGLGVFLKGGADKSLARPGRKQATETKLGIY